jgi:hypothetical protein
MLDCRLKFNCLITGAISLLEMEETVMNTQAIDHFRPQSQTTTNLAKSISDSKAGKAEGASAFVVKISSEAVLHQQQDAKRSTFLASFTPEEAGDFAKSFANDPFQYGPTGGLLDISGLQPGGDGIIRYSGDGSPVTAESEAYFERKNARFLSERTQLYASEMAKGTPSLKVLDKLLTAADNQPERYRMMMGWKLS